MAVLEADITSGDLILTVDAALSSTREGDFLVQIGEEFLLVERRGMLTNPQVKRGVFGTTAASHDEDDDVSLVVPSVQTAAPADPPTALSFDPGELPEVAATPTAQGIVDALVTLGLVTQAEA